MGFEVGAPGTWELASFERWNASSRLKWLRSKAVVLKR